MTLRPSIFSSLLLASAASLSAADRWWDGAAVDILTSGNGSSAGGTGTWNASTATTPTLNWDQGTGLAHVAWNNSAGDTAIFGGAGATVTIGSPVTANRLIFSTPNYVFTGTAVNILTLAGTSPTIVTNAGAAIGTSSVLANTMLAGTEGLTITGVGGTSLSLMSTSAHILSGGLVIKNGVSFSASDRFYSGTTNLLDPNNNLTFDGGHFSLSGYAGKTIDQTLGNATFNTLGAGTRLLITTSGSTAGTTTKLHLGTISGANLGTAGAGGLLTGLGSAPIAGTTHAITTTTAPTAANGTYGVRVIYTGDGGTTTGDWMIGTDLGGGVYQFAPYASYATMVDDDSKNNLDVALGSSLDMTVGNQAHGTLKLASATTLGIGVNILTLEMGGLISAGSIANSITGTPGGTCLTAGAVSGYELIVHPYNSAGTTVSAVIGDKDDTPLDLEDQGTSIHPIAVTVNNLNSNPLTLSGLNTYTGATTINGTSALVDGKSSVIAAFNKNKDAIPATPEIDPNPSAFGAGTSLTLNGAVIQTGTTASSDRDIATTGNSGFYVKGNFTQTLAGTISGSGTFSTDGDFGGGAGGTGNLVLAGANTFSGDIVFRTDSRITLAHADAAAMATLDLTGNRILASLFTNNLAYNIGGLKGNAADLNLGTGLGNSGSGKVLIGSNNQSNAYFGSISGAAGLIKKGNGTQILARNTYTGDTLVENGTLKLAGIPEISVTGTVASNKVNLTVPSTAPLAVGQAVSGTNISSGSVIASINSPTEVALSIAAPATGTASPVFAAMDGSIASPVIEVKSGGILDVSALASGFPVGSTQTLGGTGTVTGAVTVNGTISPALTATGKLTTADVSFGATGVLACTLDAANCDLLAAGTLTVNATAKVTVSGTPSLTEYVIATYTGPAPTHFDESALPSGYSLSYTTPGEIKLMIDHSQTPYMAWATGAPYNLTGDDAKPESDPDKEGVKNIVEFALGGNPTDGSDNGISLAKVQNAPTTPALTLTIATRAGTTFDTGSGARVGTKDGVTYTVQGGQDLSGWTTTITEVSPITTGMQPVPTGYEYHTFKTAGPISSTPKDFIRVKVVGQ